MADPLNMQQGQFGMQAPFSLSDLGGGAVSGIAGMNMLKQFEQNQALQATMNQLVQQANES